MAASDLSGTRFSDFRLRGGQEREGEKKLQWELKGKEAVLADGLIEITELQLELTGPDQEPTEVRSPECQFDRATNIGESPAPLQAVSQSMTLEGKGYHFLLDRQVIHLYNDVRMVIKSGEKSLFPLASN